LRYMMRTFIDDDNGYLDWAQTNLSGFVLNCHRSPNANYLVLHKAVCKTITTPLRANWTTNDYIKICSCHASVVGEQNREEIRYGLVAG
jgi:hypothetical protein